MQTENPIKRVIKRLEIIKNLAMLGEIDELSISISKLEESNFNQDINEIIDLLQNKEYGNAINKIENFISINKQLTIWNDPEVIGLKLEIKNLEKQINYLNNEKIELEKLIANFNHRHSIELGDIILKILKLKKRKYINDNEKFEEARKDEEEYQKQFQEEKEKNFNKLTNEELIKLKKTFRKATILCHPDKFINEPAEIQKQAENIFKKLNEANAKNDLEKVNEILFNLEQGILKTEKKDNITDKAILRSTIFKLKNKIRELETEILNIKQSEIYNTIISIEDWDLFFEQTKKRLKLELEKLIKEIEEEKKNKSSNFKNNLKYKKSSDDIEFDTFTPNYLETQGKIERKSFHFNANNCKIWKNGNCIFEINTTIEIIADISTKTGFINVNLNNSEISNYITNLFSFKEISLLGNRVLWSNNIQNGFVGSKDFEPSTMSLFYHKGNLTRIYLNVYKPEEILIEFNSKLEEQNYNDDINKNSTKFNDMENFTNFIKKFNTMSLLEKMNIAMQTDIINNQGAEAYLNDEIDLAIEKFVKALEIMPINDDALLNLTRCYTKKKDYEKSFDLLNKLYILNPVNKSKLIAYSLLYHIIKNFKNGESAVEPSTIINFVKEKFNIETSDQEIKNIIRKINKSYSRDIIVYIIGGFILGLKAKSPYMTANGITKSLIEDEILDVLNWE